MCYSKLKTLAAVLFALMNPNSVIAQCEDLFPARFFPVSTNSYHEMVDCDLNGDGRTDLIFLQAPTILMANGNGGYSAPINLSLSGVRSIAAGDVDGDGVFDLVASCGPQFVGQTTGRFATFRGLGNGSFAPAVLLTVPAAYNGGAVGLGDFNDDGLLDAVVINARMWIFLNAGTGTFADPIDAGAADAANYLFVKDLDHDGKLDLVATSSNSAILRIFYGLGNAQFATPTSISLGSNTRRMCLADMDSDSFTDILIATSNGVRALRNLANRVIQGPISVTTTTDSAVALADMDRDGDLDVVTCGALGVQVCFNTGGGVLGSPRLYTAGENPYQLVLSDVDEDGDIDVVAVDLAYLFSGAAASVSVIWNQGNGTLAARDDYAIARYGRSVAIGDINGDGLVDLVTAGNPLSNVTGAGVTTLLNTGTGTFGSRTDYPISTAMCVALGDIDNDGDLDLAVGFSNSIQTMLNNGYGVFGSPTNYSVVGSPHIKLIDMNNDGRVDLVGMGNVSLNNGNGTFGAPHTFGTSANSPVYFETGDLNGDGLPDIVVVSQLGTGAVLCRNLGNGVFGTFPSLTAGPVSFGAAIADLNGDGLLDIVMANSNSGSVNVTPGNLGIYFGRGDGTFRSPLLLSTGSNPFFVSCGDVDGDGILDLIVPNISGRDASNTQVGGGSLSLIRNMGNETFLPPLNFGTSNNPYRTALVDVNGDGNLDVIVANSCYEPSVPSEVSVLTARQIAPRITHQPQPLVACLGSNAALSVSAAALRPRTLQWRKNGVPIDSAMNSTANSPTLVLEQVQASDAALYDCVVTNSCGTATTNTASLSICLADFNCDTTVDFFDYLDFVDAFASNFVTADFNNDGTIDFFDYLDFVDTFAQGC